MRPASLHHLTLSLCSRSDRVRLCLADESPILDNALLDGRRSQEAMMKKEVFQENKARWEVFEWIGTTQTKIIWAAVAVIVGVAALYLLAR